MEHGVLKTLGPQGPDGPLGAHRFLAGASQ
jgi:hypothetical protein